MSDICIFSAQYPPHVGGVEKFTQRISKSLVGMSHRVTVVTNATDGEPGVFDDNGVEVISLPCFPCIKGRMPLPLMNAERSSMLKTVSARDFDGVLINTRFYLHSLLGMKVARRCGVTPVVLDHGSAYLTFGNDFLDVFVRMYENAITWYGKKYKSKYCGISSKSSEWLAHFGIKSSGIIQNAIDATDFMSSASNRNFRLETNTEASLMVVYAGRLIPEKGVGQLLEAAHDLKSEGRDVKLVIAGSGPLEKEVETAEGVAYFGRLDQSDLASLIAQSDVFCLPSRSEGFATCVLESFAAGTPVVSTKVGGAVDLINDRESGYLMPSNSVDDIKEGLEWALANREKLHDMGEKCKSIVLKKCSWESSSNALLNAMGLNK